MRAERVVGQARTETGKLLLSYCWNKGETQWRVLGTRNVEQGAELVD